ncbi:hypothetical protein DPMN_147788 [Dreissena polymorpha]|uniref:Uncharacterized protein n=1 Tax=Dreissena polymorpha TaxID=45954 RepID=A0A9D4J3Q1_DREPO|nr:hypothetical protein DPMN_147788 [Dreissena polymorpha]
MIGTNLVTKFHEDRTINVASRVLTMKNAPPPGDHSHDDQSINEISRVLTMFYYSHIRKNDPPLVFQPTGIKLFNEDWTINVDYSHIMKNAAPPGCHVFQATITIF